MSEISKIDEETVKDESMECEIKIENLTSDDKNIIELKTDPDRNFLLILSPPPPKSDQQTIKKEKESVDDDKSDKNANCKICNKKLSSMSTLHKHMRNIHPEEKRKECKFHCDLCVSSYKFKHFLTNHMIRDHIKKIIYQCDYDGKMFKTRDNLTKHIFYHLTLKCKICDKEMKASSLYDHMKQAHRTNSSNHKCQLCSRNLKSQRNLQGHLNWHDKKFKCIKCDKKFASKSQLQSHMTFHNDPSKTECKICHKIFLDISGLKSHLKIHDKNRQKCFKCSQCNFATYTKANYENHMKTHDKARIKDLKCSQCDYRSDRKYHLNRHLKIHDKVREKHLKCIRCDYATDVLINLINHTKFHEKHDEKVSKWKNPIKCEKCWMFCRDKKLLYMHTRQIHSDAKFQCDLCDKLFRIKQNLSFHFRQFHKIKI